MLGWVRPWPSSQLQVLYLFALELDAVYAGIDGSLPHQCHGADLLRVRHRFCNGLLPQRQQVRQQDKTVSIVPLHPEQVGQLDAVEDPKCVVIGLS